PPTYTLSLHDALPISLSGLPLPVHGDGRQTRSFCFVGDLVEGIYRLATHDGVGGEVINLGNPEEVSVLELIDTLAALVGATLDVDRKSTRLNSSHRTI